MHGKYVTFPIIFKRKKHSFCIIHIVYSLFFMIQTFSFLLLPLLLKNTLLACLVCTFHVANIWFSFPTNHHWGSGLLRLIFSPQSSLSLFLLSSKNSIMLHLYSLIFLFQPLTVLGRSSLSHDCQAILLLATVNLPLSLSPQTSWVITWFVCNTELNLFN